MRTPTVIGLLVALAASAPWAAAQIPSPQPAPKVTSPKPTPKVTILKPWPELTSPVAFDVHVLKLTTTASELVPSAEIVSSKRISADREAAERSFHVDVGGKRIGIEVHDGGSRGAFVERRFGNSTSQATPALRTLDLTDAWRWGRRPRTGTIVRGAMLCDPVREPAAPFVPMDLRGFLATAADLLLAAPPGILDANHNPEHWESAQWMAARVLGSVPLRQYLEPDQVDLILAKARKVPDDLGDAFWPLLRPLVVLAHRPTLEKLMASHPIRREGDLEAHPEDGETRTPWIPRSVEDSILIAYATNDDPEIRGLAGWIATGTRSSDVYTRLIEDVRAGRAVLPGDEGHRQELFVHLERTLAWQQTTAPLLTLIASAITIAAAMILLRLAMRRVL